MPIRCLRPSILRRYIALPIFTAVFALTGCEHINLTHYSQLEKSSDSDVKTREPSPDRNGQQTWAISDSGWWQRLMQESINIGPYTVANARPGWIKENSHYPSATEIRRETTQGLSFELTGKTDVLAVECEYRGVEQGSQGRRSAGGTSNKTIRDAQTIQQSIRCLSENETLWIWQWSQDSGWSGSGMGLQAMRHPDGIQFTGASASKLALWQNSDSTLSWQTKTATAPQQETLAAAIAALIISGQSGQ